MALAELSLQLVVFSPGGEGYALSVIQMPGSMHGIDPRPVAAEASWSKGATSTVGIFAGIDIDG
ncbi:MAG: hypothetical protein ACKVUT_09450 [Gaiella sp.]